MKATVVLDVMIERPDGTEDASRMVRVFELDDNPNTEALRVVAVIEEVVNEFTQAKSEG